MIILINVQIFFYFIYSIILHLLLHALFSKLLKNMENINFLFLPPSHKAHSISNNLMMKNA